MSTQSNHVVIRASAGTGKTYQLTNRFLRLLLDGVPPQRILATTFTRKAAGEIFDRVLWRLAQAATDQRERKQLAQALDENGLSRPRCLSLLAETIRAMHALRIGTLDSFFAQIAGSFALELGLPLGWRIAEPLEDAALRQEAVDAVLSRGKPQDLAALFHLLTKGEVNRSVVNLVLGAASDMYGLCRETEAPAWKQLPRQAGLSAEELSATIRALAQAEVPEGKMWLKARDESVAAAQDGDWKSFLSKGLANKVLCGESTYSRKPIPPHLVEIYGRMIEHVRGVMVAELARQTEATWDLLTRFATEYEQLKDQRRLLSFEDITWRLAQRIDASALERLAFRLDAGISHLLLDEFQDTSLAQWQVLRPLAALVTSDEGRGKTARSFFCVGDVKQAIYGWRGGLAEIFDALDVCLTGLDKTVLATSYRSSQPVIDAVNQVFQHLTNHDNLERLEAPVRKWQESFPPHTTAKGDLPGYVCLRASSSPKDDEDDEAVHYQFAAQEVARLAAEAPGRSVGVLVRTNQVVARMIFLLKKLGVAASEEGGNPLIDSAAVELVLSLLAIADHPGDTVARFHLAHSPLGPLVGCTNHRDDVQAATLSRSLRQRLIEEGYGPTVLHFATLLAPECDERDRSRLSQLVELAYQYQKSSTLRADDFRRLVASQKVADPSSASVRVMTIHQAKGLEFDIVVLPELHKSILGQTRPFVAGRPEAAAAVDVVCRYCDQNVRELLPPRIRSLFDEATHQAVSESLCLLYVALTRAVHALHMIIRPSDGERTLPKTYAGLLRASLAGGAPAEGSAVVYECGNSRWHEKAPAAAASAEKPVEAATSVIRLAPPEGTPWRNLERTSPSSLEGGQHVSLTRVLEPRNDGGMNYGTLIHAWLAEITWLDDGEPDDERLRSVAARLVSDIGPVAANLADPLAAFRRILSQAAVRRVLSRPAGAAEREVLREHPFAIRDGDVLLSGSIDRLVLLRRGEKVVAADVVDYKTDAIADDAVLADKVEFYRPQLEAYCRAVAKIFHVPAEGVTSRLLFLTAGREVVLGLRPSPPHQRLLPIVGGLGQ